MTYIVEEDHVAFFKKQTCYTIDPTRKISQLISF